jgi:hypothetical protein
VVTFIGESIADLTTFRSPDLLAHFHLPFN